MYGVERISNIEKAAVLLQFAREGEEHSIFSSSRSLYCYKLRCKISRILQVSSFVFAFVRFFERPLWTFSRSDWDDSAVYPMSGVPLLSPEIIAGIKIPLLTVFLFGLLLEVGYKDMSVLTLSSSRVFRLLLLTCCLSSVLILIYCVGTSSHLQLVSITSVASESYILWFNRRSLIKFRTGITFLYKLSYA